MSGGNAHAVLSVRSASLAYGARTLWSDLDLDLAPGEFVAVLGSNGTGKTSLLRAILGQQRLSSGTIDILGRPVRQGSRDIGYIPQQKLLEQGTPLRARDLVRFGIDGHRWGLPLPSRVLQDRIDRILQSVGAFDYRDVAVSTLSGGEQQRVRVGQAIAGNPQLLLCDEPLLSLDLHHQRVVSELIDEKRKELNMTVLFVTHDVNPILDMVDRVLYLAGGQFRIGTPEEVLNSAALSDMYGTPVEVFRSHGRIAVIGAPDGSHDRTDDLHHAQEHQHR